MPEGSPTGDSGITQYARMFSLEGLLYLDESGRVQPRLADHWNWENQGRRLRVTLQPRVTFHDGTPLDASAVARILDGALRNPGTLALYPSLNDVTSVTPSGNLDVVLDLARPSAFLPDDLEMQVQHGSPVQGTGPFRIVRSTSTEVELTPFEHYRLGKPSIDRIVVKAIPTLRTAWTSLLRRDLDMVTDVPPEAVEFIRTDDVRVIPVSRHYQYLVAFNSRRAPFTSPLVRRALNLAVDRQGLLSRVLNNAGAPSTGPLWPQYWAYDGTIPPYSYDPATAEALLDQAGFPRGRARASDTEPPARLRFTCLIPDNFDLWERIALEVQRNLYAVGVDMQFKVVPFQQFDTLLRAGTFDAAMIDMISGPTPARAYTFWASTRAFHGLNVFGYEDPEAQRLFDLLRASTNEAATRSATQRLERVFRDDPPALFLAWNQRTRAVRREFMVPERDGDPMLAIWRWKPASPLLTAANQ